MIFLILFILAVFGAGFGCGGAYEAQRNLNALGRVMRKHGLVDDGKAGA